MTNDNNDVIDIETKGTRRPRQQKKTDKVDVKRRQPQEQHNKSWIVSFFLWPLSIFSVIRSLFGGVSKDIRERMEVVDEVCERPAQAVRHSITLRLLTGVMILMGLFVAVSILLGSQADRSLLALSIAFGVMYTFGWLVYKLILLVSACIWRTDDELVKAKNTAGKVVTRFHRKPEAVPAE